MKEKELGTVYLVGSGPGDPDLLTVKASRLISLCDVLVYDALVPQEILELAKKDCLQIFVGKRRNKHSTPQAKTNALLFQLAKEHEIIVRLKGGDPFLFGRGGEEASFLYRKGISVQVVPGITSGMAASTYSGIPLTHRLAGSSVTFVTGHEGIDKRRPLANWKDLAKASNTLVIYMGVHNLNYIVDELLSSGLPPNIPAAVVQQATVTGQRFLKTSLSHLVEEVRVNNFISPAIIIIGNVINFQIQSCAPKPAEVTMPISF